MEAGVSLDWLMDDLVGRLGDVRGGIVLSADGLLVARSTGMAEADGEHLAAVCSGLHSLALGAGRHFGGGRVRQTVVEMDHAFLVVTSAGTGASLAVIAAETADLALIAYELNLMVRRVGEALAARTMGGS